MSATKGLESLRISSKSCCRRAAKERCESRHTPVRLIYQTGSIEVALRCSAADRPPEISSRHCNPQECANAWNQSAGMLMNTCKWGYGTLDELSLAVDWIATATCKIVRLSSLWIICVHSLPWDLSSQLATLSSTSMVALLRAYEQPKLCLNLNPAKP